MQKTVLFLLALLVLSPCCKAGPFGFEAGMTLQQVYDAVGRENVTEDSAHPYWYTTRTAPHPDGLFESYDLHIHPEIGLVKIRAALKDIETNVYGSELKETFKRTRDSLISTYGNCRTSDSLREGSIWDEPKDWMSGLRANERVLAAYWTKEDGSNLKDRITRISLTTHALGQSKGFLLLTYEFVGLDEAIKEEKAAEDKLF